MPLYDELNAPFVFDAEGPGVRGFADAVEQPPLQNGQATATLPTYITPFAAKRAAAIDFAGARARAYFEHAPEPKYADESTDPNLTPAPVVGQEANVHLMNATAYNPYLVKGPKYSNPPSTASIVANQNQQTSSTQNIGSSDAAILALLYGA